MQQNEITRGLKAIGIAVFFGIAVSPKFAGFILLGIAIYYAISAFNELQKPGAPEQTYERRPQQTYIPPTSSAPLTDETTIAEKIKSIHLASGFKCPNCGATVKPTDMKCGHCGSFLTASAKLPKPRIWPDVEIGQEVRVKHPEEGNLALPVRYRVFHAELWQSQMKQNVPWTLTGNYFVGLGLGKEKYLLNWQSRYFLLDSRSPLTDQDINRNFASHAREFAASNQTKIVRFAYAGTQWQVADIGRFRIEYVEGEETNAQPGAVGRFIHAKAGDRILVIEDYQSGGGGLDTLWLGYEIPQSFITL